MVCSLFIVLCPGVSEHFFGLQNRLAGSDALSGCLRVYGTVNQGEPGRTSHTAFLAGNARADFTGASGSQFVAVIRIRQQRTDRVDDIAYAVQNGRNSSLYFIAAPFVIFIDADSTLRRPAGCHAW